MHPASIHPCFSSRGKLYTSAGTRLRAVVVFKNLNCIWCDAELAGIVLCMGPGSCMGQSYRSRAGKTTHETGLCSQEAEKGAGRDAVRPASALRSLLFEDNLSFFRRQFFFAHLPRYVAQRRRFRNRTKLPKRLLSLRVAVCIAADKRLLGSHRMLLSVQGVIGHLNNLRLVGENGCGLSKRRPRTKYDQCQKCSFHGRVSHPL